MSTRATRPTRPGAGQSEHLPAHLQVARAAIAVARARCERPETDALIVQGLTATCASGGLRTYPTWTLAFTELGERTEEASRQIGALAQHCDLLVALTGRPGQDLPRIITFTCARHLVGQLHIQVLSEQEGRDLSDLATFPLSDPNAPPPSSSWSLLEHDSLPVAALGRIPGQIPGRHDVQAALTLIGDWVDREDAYDLANREAFGLWRGALTGDGGEIDAAGEAVMLQGFTNQRVHQAAMLATLPKAGAVPEQMVDGTVARHDVPALHQAAITGKIAVARGKRLERVMAMTTRLAKHARAGGKAPACTIGAYAAWLAGDSARATVWLSWALADDPSYELAATMLHRMSALGTPEPPPFPAPARSATRTI